MRCLDQRQSQTQDGYPLTVLSNQHWWAPKGRTTGEKFHFLKMRSANISYYDIHFSADCALNTRRTLRHVVL